MKIKILCLTLVMLLIFSGCGSTQAETPTEAPTEAALAPTELPIPEAAPEETEPVYVDAVELDIQQIEQEAAILEEPAEPAIPDILEPVASGELVQETEQVIIDYSNTSDGYVMVFFKGETSKRLKVQVKSSTTYTYNLPQQQWTVFPLSDGNGHYQVKVFINTSGSQYSLLTAVEQDVTLADEFAPFLRPNQYVDYSAASKAVETAWEITRDIENPLGKVEAVYNYVVKELTYDNEKAATVKSGYIPVLDSVLEEKKGICFDYASLMTGMLRSQGIPCKMVFGYTGGAYHAWISVWTEDTGWVDGVIFFDGIAWQRLDPTFASYDNQSDRIMRYIGDGSNYSEKYFY